MDYKRKSSYRIPGGSMSRSNLSNCKKFLKTEVKEGRLKLDENLLDNRNIQRSIDDPIDVFRRYF